MADILIRIPDEIVSFININGFIPQEYIKGVNKALLESKQLPKGYGRLIDENVKYMRRYEKGRGIEHWIATEGEKNGQIDKQILWNKAGTSNHITRADVNVRPPKDNSGTQALNEGYTSTNYRGRYRKRGMNMAQYHVGCGLTEIYAGTLNRKGNMWLNKSVVTDEAFNAVAQYCLEHNEALEFDYEGKKYRLSVSEVKAEGSEKE